MCVLLTLLLVNAPAYVVGLQLFVPTERHNISNGWLLPSYGIPASLWNGSDGEAPSKLTQAASILMDSQPNSGGVRTHILGHYNTGTNLLEAMVHKNFPDVEVRAGTVPDRRLRNNEWGGPCDFWKHVDLSFLKLREPETLEACSSMHVVGLAMIRNPLSWLNSFKSEAYDLQACSEGDDWLTQPCSYPVCKIDGHLSSERTLKHGRRCADTYHSIMGGREYSNVEDIWNLWLRDYERLSEFGFEKMMVIRYEDLVINTEETLAKIATRLGTDTLATVKQVHSGVSPNNNAPDTRSVAVEKIKQKDYLKHFTKQQLHEACSRLDQDVMLRHGYDDCQQI